MAAEKFPRKKTLKPFVMATRPIKEMETYAKYGWNGLLNDSCFQILWFIVALRKH